ncbi:hypothetical protein D3C71_1224790 [compost metagenome]
MRRTVAAIAGTPVAQEVDLFVTEVGVGDKHRQRVLLAAGEGAGLDEAGREEAVDRRFVARVHVRARKKREVALACTPPDRLIDHGISARPRTVLHRSRPAGQRCGVAVGIVVGALATIAVAVHAQPEGPRQAVIGEAGLVADFIRGYGPGTLAHREVQAVLAGLVQGIVVVEGTGLRIPAVIHVVAHDPGPGGVRVGGDAQIGDRPIRGQAHRVAHEHAVERGAVEVAVHRGAPGDDAQAVVEAVAQGQAGQAPAGHRPPGLLGTDRIADFLSRQVAAGEPGPLRIDVGVVDTPQRVQIKLGLGHHPVRAFGALLDTTDRIGGDVADQIQREIDAIGQTTLG